MLPLKEEYQFNAQIGDKVKYKNKPYVVVGTDMKAGGMSFSVFIVKEGISLFRKSKEFRDENINQLELIS